MDKNLHMGYTTEQIIESMYRNAHTITGYINNNNNVKIKNNNIKLKKIGIKKNK